MTDRGMGAILLGKVKWFGGVNNSTGRENHFGFIEADGVAFFVHRSEVLSPRESMIEGAEVLFRRLEDRSGKPTANAVRVITETSDDEFVALLKETASPSSEFVLTIAVIRKKLAPFTNEVFRACKALGAARPEPKILGRFWNEFPPLEPSDRFYDVAPEAVKSKVCKKHFSALRHALLNLLGKETQPRTFITAKELYEGLNDDDRKIAALWADSKVDAIVAKMLSARAAEKAVAELYRQAGAIVDDVAITQLERAGGDWITHDLSVDRKISIDVKNSRRPINSKHFYVEHTVARFKLDRSGSDVRIAGVLSPYLQKQLIEKPSSADFTIDDIVLLGETSRQDIEALITKYRSPHFEVVRGNERIFPNWVFGHPERWYPGFREQVQSATELCRQTPEEFWCYIFDTDEAGYVTAALGVINVPLPPVLLNYLTKQQVNFCEKLKRSLDGIPNVPDIFLAVISDFVEAIICNRQDYSPAIYTTILFPKLDRDCPLGAIDPLRLVASLVKTLTLLWENRTRAVLKGFTSFRFGGLGLLQARRNNEVKWTTIVAYCGGTEYVKDENDNIEFLEAGRPKWKGKCGNSPLVLGRHQTCSNCRKLLCEKCKFCSVECRDQKFRALTLERKGVAPSRKKEFSSDSGQVAESTPWEKAPWGAYEDYY